MKKIISFCKSHLLKKWSALFSSSSDKDLYQDVLKKSDEFDDYDPVPEPAKKLSYVYFDKPVEQKRTVCYYSPYLGLEREIRLQSRKNRGKPFDNVRGIRISEKIILLRGILFLSQLPDDIREIAKQYEGRFPTKEELKQIYANFNEINQNLYECGEPLLLRWMYLYTTGDEKIDKEKNYCINFQNGNISQAKCNSFVCAVLVE